MKFNRKLVSLALILVTILNFSIIGSIPISAHDAILDVTYDDCVIDENNSDGINEIWYILDTDTFRRHISHEVETITYRFEGTDDQWTPYGKSQEIVDEIKSAYASSMEKWNNIYFYSYNSDGSITKKQLINLVEITQGEANITIYPSNTLTLWGTIAQTYPLGLGEEIPGETISHDHYQYWGMDVNVDAFCEDSLFTIFFEGVTNADIELIKENTGAHEMGHVLGLRDVDNYCNADNDIEHGHHHEVLMGYGEPVYTRSADITYKDIAGVAITRGFHTDDDHRWLTTGALNDGEYKLICSICNGVKYVESLTEYPHDMYAYCEGDHELSDGNMMAVASYGNQDYYKCKYCRYVAPFSEIVEQDYTKTNFSTYLHKYVNNVEGLEYTFYEAHQYTCVSISNLSHRSTCDCGETKIAAHYISGSHAGEDFVPCAGCGYLLDLRDGAYDTIMSITQVSVNGSYIRPDGIVVLVDEDIEAYLAGTLQFYHPEDVPVTQ